MRQRQLAVRTAFLCALTVPSTYAFYLPGVAPTSYELGEVVPLHVNRLSPAQSQDDAQIRALDSLDYYAPIFHFCRPEGGPEDVSESLGSIIFGDRIQTSPFDLRMAQNESCKTLFNCGPRKFEKFEAQFVNKKIWQNYQINWLVDGLPAGQPYIDPTTGTSFYSPGFELGRMDGDRAIFNNHYDIYIDYHVTSLGQHRVVGVLVEPSSNRNAQDHGAGAGQCDHREDLVLDENGITQVVFTYSVSWKPSAVPFATRWDKYLHVYDPKIHWFSLVNSAIIVVFLSVMVFVILVRTLRKDITRYNRLDEFAMGEMSNGHANGEGHSMEDSAQEDSGWKLVHGDVFRPPHHALLLSVLLGNGLQLFMMAGFTIAFALFGFLSPSNRGSVGSVMILLYTLFSVIGGFVSTYTYKTFLHGATDKTGSPPKWRHNIGLTPFGLPAVVFSVFFFLDLILWARQSSGAVPFTTMLVIIAIWFIISVPLSFLGSWLALRRPPIEPPVRTNQIPRQIPESAISTTGFTGFLNRPIPSMLLTGILPFGAIFVEIHFIMSSLWSSKIYYMFGFLFLCYGLMIVTCATVTILSIYFVLCAENYQWQWRSFATGGACALYVFINAMVFWGSRLSYSSMTSSLLYFSYSFLISLIVFVLTGKSISGAGCRDVENPLMMNARHYRLLLVLGICAHDLQVTQGRLIQLQLTDLSGTFCRNTSFPFVCTIYTKDGATSVVANRQNSNLILPSGFISSTPAPHRLC